MKFIITQIFFALIILSGSVCLAQQKSFNPSGYFVPNQSQKNASKVRWILLSDYCEIRTPNAIYAELRIGTETRWETFLQSSITLKNNKVGFKTKSKNGIAYEFEGQFLLQKKEKESGRFEESSGKITALKGILKTKRGKKIVVSEKLSFYYTIGD